MAEAFGLVTGVLQVAGFGAEVSSTLFKCAKKFHNASKDLEDIASKVETTSVSLRQVTALLKDPTTKALHTQKLYEDTATVSNGCLEVFHELDNYVKSFESKSGFQKMTLRSKARWLFDGNKVHELGQVLRRYSDVLHLMISVMAIVEGRRAATKDELQALEADLKLLALSNKDLSHSNKTLTDTIAAMSRASVNPVVSKSTTPPITSLVTDGEGLSRALPVASLLAMPSANLPPIIPRKQSSDDRMTDHLQRCMKSVQELALSISCALDTLHGHEKTGSSDVHGSYTRLSIAMAQLPTHVSCDQCKQNVAWSHFEPARRGIGQSGACKCRSQTPLQYKDPCRDYDIGFMNVESIKMSHHRAQSLLRASQGKVRQELDHTAVAGFEAQAQRKGQDSDDTVLPIPQTSSAGMLGANKKPCGSLQQRQRDPQVANKNGAQFQGASESLSSYTHYGCSPGPPTHSLYPCHPIDISFAPAAMPTKDTSNNDHSSPGNKQADCPNKIYAMGSASTSTPEATLRDPRLLDLYIQQLGQRSTPAARCQSPSTMTLPYTTQKSSLGQRGDGTSSHLDQYVRDRALMMHKHLFQQQLARQQQQQQQQQRQQQQQMQQMQQQQQQSNSHPLSNDFELFDSRQQRHAPVPEDQKPLHQSTGNSASLAQYQARLAELEGQNRKRLLMAREDQDPWAQAPNTWSLSSDVPPATRKDTYDVIEDTEKIKKAAIEDRRPDAASEPEHPAMSTPIESTVTYADNRFGLNMDFAGVSAGGGDALDNFDFDSFLDKDDGGMGFDFRISDRGLADGVDRAQDHTSQVQVDTENAPQHGQKRSRSDAFPGSPEQTPMSQRQKCRAISLSPRIGEVCESSMKAVELPTDSDKSEIPTESLSGVEALLQRWFDASATAMLLGPSDGQCRDS